MRKIAGLVTASVLVMSSVFVVSAPAQAATKYKNCDALYKKYAYGIKLKGAKDKVDTATRSPATNAAQVSKSTYDANKKLDTDKDKIACERTKYKNCTVVNKTYIHGVGIKGAKDKTTGIPVTNFKVVLTPTVKTNSHLDRDKDNIFCEKL